MAKIYKYRKVTDKHTTHALFEPDYNLSKSEDRVTELCTINGETYVAVPDGLVLPPQPKEITLEQAEMSEKIEADIRANSPHIQLINDRVVARIRERYSVNDEIKMLRIGPSAETEAYNDHVEMCREWGRKEKDKILSSIKMERESWLVTKTFEAAAVVKVSALEEKP